MTYQEDYERKRVFVPLHILRPWLKCVPRGKRKGFLRWSIVTKYINRTLLGEQR